MVRRNTRRLNRRRQRKQRGGIGGPTSAYYRTLVPVDVNALDSSGRATYNGCTAPMFDVFNGNNLDQAFLSASDVAPSRGGGRKTRKVRKSRKSRKVRKVRRSRKVRKTKRKQRGGGVGGLVTAALALGAVVGGASYAYSRWHPPLRGVEEGSIDRVMTL